MKNYKTCDICGHKYPSGHPCLNCQNKYPGRKVTPELIGSFVKVLHLQKNDHVIVKLDDLCEENQKTVFDAFNHPEYKELNIKVTVAPIDTEIIVIRTDEQEKNDD